MDIVLKKVRKLVSGAFGDDKGREGGNMHSLVLLGGVSPSQLPRERLNLVIQHIRQIR